jgi:hypothetical protein
VHGGPLAKIKRFLPKQKNRHNWRFFIFGIRHDVIDRPSRRLQQPLWQMDHPFTQARPKRHAFFPRHDFPQNLFHPCVVKGYKPFLTDLNML